MCGDEVKLDLVLWPIQIFYSGPTLGVILGVE